MTKIISIVLAEDHVVVRQAIRLMLERHAEFKLLGEADDGLQAVRMVEELKPDILVTDLMIPRLHGLEVIRHLRRHSPKTKVVVLSMSSDEHSVIEALHSGASGYVLKESTSAELILAIKEVFRGKCYVTSTLADYALVASTKKGGEENCSDPFSTLTSRERLVLRLAAEGRTTLEIAKELFISPRTAETHRANLMRKLNLTSQTDLVRLAIRKGIIQA